MPACREAILKLLKTESQGEQKNMELQSTHTISVLQTEWDLGAMLHFGRDATVFTDNQ